MRRVLSLRALGLLAGVTLAACSTGGPLDMGAPPDLAAPLDLSSPAQDLAAAPSFDGTYTSHAVGSDGYTHDETDMVAGTAAHGEHTFTNGQLSGSFTWQATLSPTSATHATLAGSGTIDNQGMRSFTLTGQVTINADRTAQLCWSGNDSMFGPIGNCTIRPAP